MIDLDLISEEKYEELVNTALSLFSDTAQTALDEAEFKRLHKLVSDPLYEMKVSLCDVSDSWDEEIDTENYVEATITLFADAKLQIADKDLVKIAFAFDVSSDNEVFVDWLF